MIEPQALPPLDPALVVKYILKDIEETIESFNGDVTIESSSTISTHFALEIGLFLGLRMPELAEKVKDSHAKMWGHAANQNVEQIEMIIQETVRIILGRAHAQEVAERAA
jgi:hypothetical protein